MSFIDKLERKFGKFAIRNLMIYVIAMYIVGFLVVVFWPNVYSDYLCLDVSKVLQGQVWRVITFIIMPPTTSYLWIAISLYCYYFLGTTLERTWGSFKFNLYYFSGILFTVIAAFIIYFVFGLVFPMSIYYINMALFLAFAVMYGDVVFQLFFIFPIKARWLAYIDGALIVAQIVFGYAANILPINVQIGLMQMGIMPHPVYATEALVSLFNFGIFMLATNVRRKNKAQRDFNNAYKQAMKEQYEKAAKEAKQRSELKSKLSGKGAGVLVHKCAVCGKTNLDNPDMEFRFCSKCNGQEYCSEHLYTHVHVNE